MTQPQPSVVRVRSCENFAGVPDWQAEAPTPRCRQKGLHAGEAGAFACWLNSSRLLRERRPVDLLHRFEPKPQPFPRCCSRFETRLISVAQDLPGNMYIACAWMIEFQKWIPTELSTPSRAQAASRFFYRLLIDAHPRTIHATMLTTPASAPA